MKSTYFFPQQLLRLKELLKAKEDQDVATALGMTKAAFSARKARGSFPETELYALAARQPELGIDVPYVLTGVTQEATARLDALQHTIEAASAAGLSIEQMRAAAGAVAGPSGQRLQALAEMLKSLRVPEFDAVYSLVATITQLRHALEKPPAKTPPKKRA